MELGTTMMMVIVFVLGLALAVQSGKIDDKLKKGCDDKKVKDSSKGLLVLAIIFMTASASYLVCNFTSKCSGPSGPPNKFGPMLYVGFFLLLGITLTTLGSIIHGAASGPCSGAKKEVVSVIVMGVLMMVTCLGFLGYKGYSSGTFAKLAPTPVGFGYQF